MTENLQMRLAARPEGLPKSSDFELRQGPVPEPADGEVLVRNVYLSLEPAMRGWMTDRKSYLPPVGLGDVMRGVTVGVVQASRDPAFSPGDRVGGALGCQLYATTPGKRLERVPPGIDLPTFLGPLGATGMTAYFGLFDVGQPKPGETVLVSAASGAVGSLVGQLARIHGCRVVGTTGGEDKRRYLVDELGFDAAIDYRATPDLNGAIREACPTGVDVYFDNVGGATLDAALRRLAMRGRVVLCGAISGYNATESVPGPVNYLSLLTQRGRMQGFIVFDYAARYREAREAMMPWLAEGRLKWRAEIVDGLEAAPEALLRLFDGSKVGKLMVRLGPDPA